VVLERAKGIEPSYAAWEAAVLPLNYARGAKLFSITGPLCKFPCSIPVNFSAVCFDMFERPNQRFVFGKYGFHRTQRNARLSSRSPSRSYQRPCARRTCSGFQASIIRTAFLNSARCPQRDSRMSSGDLPSGSTTPPIRSSARSHGGEYGTIRSSQSDRSEQASGSADGRRRFPRQCRLKRQADRSFPQRRGSLIKCLMRGQLFFAVRVRSCGANTARKCNARMQLQKRPCSR
jgi:hypothetical protein